MSPKFDKHPIFPGIGRGTANKKLAYIEELIKKHSSFLGMGDMIPGYSEEVLIEIFERVEKRRLYFHVFYNKCDMSELNEVSLICFWIAKLHPFHHPAIDSSKLNTKIALCMFIEIIQIYLGLEKAGQSRKVPEHFIKDLFYGFLYRDISKESLMLLAESFLNEKPGQQGRKKIATADD